MQSIEISPENISVSTEEKQMVITTYHVSIVCGINQDTEKRRESGRKLIETCNTKANLDPSFYKQVKKKLEEIGKQKMFENYLSICRSLSFGKNLKKSFHSLNF